MATSSTRPLRALAGAALAAAAIPLLGACVTPFDGAETCVSWVDFATPADAFAGADVVVVGRVVGEAGSQAVYGTTARVHRVQIDSVLAGDPPAGELDVASVPVTCEGSGPYPHGDPLDVTGPVVVFLHHDDESGQWWTLTPRHGVVAATEDGRLPATWTG